MEKKENHKLCIIIIPPTAKVKRLSIPSWLPKAVPIALVLMFIALGLVINSMHSSYISLKKMYSIKSSELDSLKRENEEKDLEIYNLKVQNDRLYARTTEVDNKLMEIDKLQRQLEKMAGIQSPSRGGGLAESQRLQDMESTDGLKAILDTLDFKERELQNFIADMEERFEYLETVPDLWPSSGRLTSGFGMRRNPFGRGREFHEGIDIANSQGTDIVAAAKGIVVFSGYKSGYGRTIIIDHENGYKTLYAHNSRLLVSFGHRVEKGQVIAKMGSTGRSTGPHLHFEVHIDGKPVDPLTVLK